MSWISFKYKNKYNSRSFSWILKSVGGGRSPETVFEDFEASILGSAVDADDDIGRAGMDVDADVEAKSVAEVDSKAVSDSVVGVKADTDADA